MLRSVETQPLTGGFVLMAGRTPPPSYRHLAAHARSVCAAGLKTWHQLFFIFFMSKIFQSPLPAWAGAVGGGGRKFYIHESSPLIMHTCVCESCPTIRTAVGASPPSFNNFFYVPAPIEALVNGRSNYGFQGPTNLLCSSLDGNRRY